MKFETILAGWMTLAVPLAAAPYTFVSLETSDGQFRPTALDDSRRVFGTFLSKPFEPGVMPVPAAMYVPGVITLLQEPTQPRRVPFEIAGVNNAGSLVGFSFQGAGGGPTLKFESGEYSEVVVPGIQRLAASDINNLGQIVGAYSTGPGGAFGFVLSGSVVTSFTAPNAVELSVSGLNDTGQIVGSVFTGAGPQPHFAYLLSGGAFTELRVPGATRTTPVAVNNSQQVVGTYTDAAGSHGFQYLNGAYSEIIGPGGGAFLPVGLNNRGDIAGVSLGQTSGFFLGVADDGAQPVTEPSSLWLLAGVVIASGVAHVRSRVVAKRLA